MVISAVFPYQKQYADVIGHKMAYSDQVMTALRLAQLHVPCAARHVERSSVPKCPERCTDLSVRLGQLEFPSSRGPRTRPMCGCPNLCLDPVLRTSPPPTGRSVREYGKGVGRNRSGPPDESSRKPAVALVTRVLASARRYPDCSAPIMHRQPFGPTHPEELIGP
jgi:hypothetical protein